MRKSSGRIVRIALLGAQLAVAIVVCELMYRGYLMWFADFGGRQSSTALPELLHVYWPQPFTFRTYGFDYGPPSRKVARLQLRRDESEPFGYRVMNLTLGIYDDFGNMPPTYSDHRANGGYTDVAYDQADLKILVFGSSFTAGSWPDIMQHRLEQMTGLRVRVLNFGRDSCGVMQAMDVADYFVPRLKPDFFLFGFTTSDLITPRTWRGVSKWHGYDRVFISTTEEPIPPNEINRTLGDAALVNAVVGQLVDEYVSTGVLPGGGDPRIGKLIDQAREFATHTARATPRIEMFDVTRSFVYNIARYGDPYQSVELEYPERTGHKLLEIDDFRKDARMAGAIGRLNTSAGSYGLVHLPRLDLETSSDRKIQLGKNGRPASQEQRLIRSLEAITGHPVFYLASRLPRQIQDFSDFIQPDQHPNKLGASLYAEIVAEYLIERMRLPRTSEVPPNVSLQEKLAELRRRNP